MILIEKCFREIKIGFLFILWKVIGAEHYEENVVSEYLKRELSQLLFGLKE